MKSILKKVGSCLRQTWVWTLLLVLSIVLLVWWAGPLLAINDVKFWADASARLVTISVLCLAWGLCMVFVSWRAGVRKKAVEHSEVSKERQRQDELIDASQKELRARFKDALRTLKTSSVYRGHSERWREELPWYVLMGPPASGKTSLLDFSGLDFPLNKIDRKLTRNTRGTEHCDWYFAEHGVLIDTAGRYLSQGPGNVDASGWNTLLGLLRKRRRERPLNGVLVTLPVDLLFSDAEERLSSLAEEVRLRLQEVHATLHVEVPVYLVLSKADTLPGFTEFFDSLTREESEQVLGASFGKEQNGSDVSLVRAEFEALLSRLNSQVITRMHQERDSQRRGRILDFPHQLGNIGERLCLFVDMAFTGNRYQRASPLRGFYLTSAPHLKQRTQVVTQDIASGAPMKTQDLPTLHSGRSHFIRHLLSRVIFPEAQLASLDKRERRRIHWGQRAMYAGALATLGAMGLLWTGSFSANHERLDTLRGLAQHADTQRSLLSPQDDARATLDILETYYAATRVFPAAGDVALYERTGLYQGTASHSVLNQAYERELETRLLPKVARQLERQISANLNDRGRLLNSVRAYLMLGMPERRDDAWLKTWVASDWSARYPGNAAVQEALNRHFERLLKRGFKYSLNDTLVAQARQVLRNESLATVVYRMLRDQAHSLEAYSFDRHLGPQGSLVNGAGYTIPGFYTQQGYQQYFSVKGATLVSDILRDNWVLGEGSSISGMDLRKLMVELEQLYFRDYATHWSEAIGQLSLHPFSDAREGAEQLAGLTSANSPIVQLLLQIRENTRFPSLADDLEALPTVDGKAGQQLAAVANGVSAAVANTSASVTPSLPDTAKKALQRRFEPLHRLLDENNGPAASLLPALQGLNEVQLQLASLARASASDQAAFDLAKSRMGGQRDALSNLRQTAQRLPGPLNGWFNGVAQDTWGLVLNDAYQFINQRYQRELYSFYERAIKKRYPFSAHSSSDVALNDFREFFRAQGISERFFETYMKPFVSGDAASYRLRTLEGQGLPMSRVYFEQMAAAQVIRQSFFAQNPATPQVDFTLEPYNLDSSVRRAEFRFGNQTLEYRHGPIVPVTLQWPTEADNGRTSLVLEKAVGRPVGIEKSTGPWSLFRVLDLMQVDYLSGRDVMVLKAEVGGLRANYLLMSQRTPNPFDMSVLRSFRLPGQL
ncbi:type VI secretion system protein ImpL [Pseudomonas taetrolens]|uniref:Type VI secretion protein VasK n=1 Tax=Pseudomonas taetrolens TaxID=47884 RepID=A0A0J6GXF9_PSETA|nr:type VI secretion system membrane subunit TssM [Pseudomonas taetrolens]KMM87013.1 type VI secretion protein VasK [Pseudomonas taetrolens]SEB57280.1 type VI secretion system protein ImpL [Pseudomonas taetrolens]SQF84874.1 type VI secretion protein IcmF [Pseudomonas taetrolens]VEH46663.1 type VI secretion protein IcmF [Pseudomonas taetrolens]